MHSKDNLVWSITAKCALWKQGPISDLQILALPEIGKKYLIKLDGRDVKVGDTVNIEYQSASVYYNGVETISDLDGIRIFSGTVERLVPSRRTDGQPLEFNTEATFEVLSAHSLNDFEKESVRSADNLELWSYFNDGFFYNLTNLDEYILLSWASDSYAGSTCIMQRRSGGFFLLYSHEWLNESFNQIHCGRISAPSILAERLNRRLVAMACGERWYGHSI